MLAGPWQRKEEWRIAGDILMTKVMDWADDSNALRNHG